MGRSLLPIAAAAAALLAACRGCTDRPSSDRPEATAPIEHVTPGPTAPPPGPPDAAPPVDAEPIKPGDVISGNAAEQLIAEQVTPAGADAGAVEVTDLTITPHGVGPFRLGQTRREVMRLAAGHAKTTRLDTDPGEPTVEYVDYLGDAGVRLLRVKLYAARVSEIVVSTTTRHALTDQDVGIGTTFEDAVLGHGATRRVEGGKAGNARGFMLTYLPGVIFVPEDTDVLALPEPPPTARIGYLIVVGPEVD